MRKFTKLWQLMMILLLSSTIGFAQVSSLQQAKLQESKMKLEKQNVEKAKASTEPFVQKSGSVQQDYVKTDLSQVVSDKPGGNMIDGSTCPVGTVYGLDISAFSNAMNSDAGGGYRVFQKFDGAFDITALHWWGLHLYFNGTAWVACMEEPLAFEIGIYQDNAGLPGALVNSYTATIAGTDAGVPFGTYGNIYEYHYTLPATVSLTSGWVSFWASPEGDPLCWFLWINSGAAGTAYQQYDVAAMTYTAGTTPASLCLVGAPSSVNDVAVTDITSPVTGPTGVQNVTIEVTNYGSASQSNIPVEYTFNAVTYNGVVPGPIASLGTALYTFGTTINPALGSHSITACANLVGDEDASNDCFTKNFEIANWDCYWTIDLYDSYGDGWNGALMDVIVDGNTLLDDITVPAGSGPESFSFGINAGSNIDLWWHTAGSWPGECSYIVYDSYGTPVYSSTAPPPTNAYLVGSCELIPAPPNDECTSATLVTGPYPQTELGTVSGATIDCPGVLDWNAVWYEVTLPYALNSLHVDYCGTGDQATIGIVYYFDCSDCNAYVVANTYSFYDCGTGVTVGQMDFNSIPGPGTIFFPVYMLPIQDFTVTFDVTELLPVLNDDCANAEAIGEVVNLPWSTITATPDTYGTCMTSNNIWYNYTATMEGDLSVSLCGSGFDTKLALYDNFDCGTMVEVGCNDDFCGLQSQIDYGYVTAGTQLKIEVGGFGTASGSGVLSITVSAPTFPLTGTINYDNNANTPMDAVTINLMDGVTTIATTMTNSMGEYSLLAPAGTYTLESTTTKPWLLNDGLDVILTKRWIAGLFVFTPIRLMAADVNQSGAPDGLDVIMMKRRIAGQTYPAWTAPNYIFYDENVTVAGATVHNYEALSTGDVNGSNTPPMQIPANDECATPTVITGPYPVTGVTGSTMYATPSCPLYMDPATMPSGEVWYAVDLPYALNTVVISYCGDALMDNGWIIGTTVQCSCTSTDYLTAASFNFAAPCVTDMTWNGVAGPGTFYYPVATGSVQEGFTIDFDVQEYIVSGYCDATTGTQDEFIGTVTCGTINNPNNVWQAGIADYTAQSTSIAAGGSAAITVLNGGNLYASDIVTVWVDWNANYLFEQLTNEEFLLLNVGGTGATFTGNIAVPVGTPAGTYRMRVRMTYSTAPVPCGASSYGEIEEYSIVVP